MSLFGPPKIGELEKKGNIRGLIKALGYQEDPAIRKGASEALSRIGSAAVEPLIAVLTDKDEIVRRFAAKALGEIADARAVEPLIASLKDGDKIARANAAWALGKAGDARAVEPLIAALKDSNEVVRKNARAALIKAGPPAVEPLVAALEDKYPLLRQNAALALCQLPDPRAVEPLIVALKDSQEVVRQNAAEALVKIGAAAVEPLIAALRDEVRDTRKAAAEALAKIGDTRAVEPLFVALEDKDCDIRKSAAEGLEKLGWQPGKDETGATYWVAKGNWDECAAIGAPAVETLVAVLQNASLTVRKNAAEALGKIGDARAVEPLIAALEDTNVSIRDCAAEALGKIVHAQGTETLTAALQNASPKVRKNAAGALAKSGEGVREAVARTLAQIGDTRAVKALTAAVESLTAELFHGGSTYDFNEPDGSLKYRSSGLEGMYIAILKLQRQGYALEGHYEGIVDFVRNQVTTQAPENADKTELLDIVNGPVIAGKKVEQFVKYMDGQQKRICRKTYSHDEAVKIIREAIEKGFSKHNRTHAWMDTAFNLEIERWPALVEKEIAPNIGLKPKEPNPSMTIAATWPISGYFGIYCALRYGAKTCMFGDDLSNSRFQELITYLVDHKYLEQMDATFYTGHFLDYDFSMVDTLFHAIRLSDYDTEVQLAFVGKMPVGSSLIYWHPHATGYPEEYFDAKYIDTSSYDEKGRGEIAPVIFTKKQQPENYYQYIHPVSLGFFGEALRNIAAAAFSAAVPGATGLADGLALFLDQVGESSSLAYEAAQEQGIVDDVRNDYPSQVPAPVLRVISGNVMALEDKQQGRGLGFVSFSPDGTTLRMTQGWLRICRARAELEGLDTDDYVTLSVRHEFDEMYALAFPGTDRYRILSAYMKSRHLKQRASGTFHDCITALAGMNRADLVALLDDESLIKAAEALTPQAELLALARSSLKESLRESESSSRPRERPSSSRRSLRLTLA
jgi:HEAT repeat protein